MKASTLLRAAGFAALALLALSAPAHLQEDSEKPELTTASPPEARRLLDMHQAATESEDSARIVASLVRMTAHDNGAFLAHAKNALKYRASKVDKEAVKVEGEELGISDRKGLEKLARQREVEVQSAAARLLANFPDETSTLLLKSLKDKKLCRGKPRLTAALIDALGRTRCARAEGEVEGHFKQFGDKDVMRASIRFFGQVKSRDKGTVRTLCELLEPPEPGNVDSPTNPPASYWAARWEQWNYFRRDVTWSLRQITGQTFRPAEGKKSGDSVKALKYVREHAKELGLE